MACEVLNRMLSLGLPDSTAETAPVAVTTKVRVKTRDPREGPRTPGGSFIAVVSTCRYGGRNPCEPVACSSCSGPC